MNANRYFEDDDLALYAMHLLAEPEASAVAQEVAENEQTRSRLSAVQQRLGLYAEASVDLLPLPEGSAGRFLGRLAKEPRELQDGKQRDRTAATPPAAVVPISTHSAAPVFSASGYAEDASTARPRSRTASVLSWTGWAVAAALAVTAGKLYHDRTALQGMLGAQTGAVVQLSTDRADVLRDKQAMDARIADQEKEITRLSAAVSIAQGNLDTLRSSLSAQTAKLDAQTARLRDQTSAATVATGQLASTQHDLATTTQERDALRSTVAAQTSQVATLNAEAARAREVLDALTDRSALRVTLTAPKSQAAPTGRATYLQSRGTLVFLGNNLAQLPANKVYELWLLPANGSAPVPAGTFSPDAHGNASIVTPHLAGATEAKAFAITIENEGGATSPTMPIVLVSGA